MSKKNQKNTPPTNGTVTDATSKIDAIKELIFGENIEKYDHEFESLKADILKKKQELETFIDDTKRELLQSIDSMGTDVNIRITELEDRLADKAEHLDDKKLDRKQLGDLLITLGEKISK